MNARVCVVALAIPIVTTAMISETIHYGWIPSIMRTARIFLKLKEIESMGNSISAEDLLSDLDSW